MRHAVSIAAALTGVAAALSVACSGTVDPSPEISRSSPRVGNQGTSSNGAKQASSPTLTTQESGTRSRLQAVSPVNQKIVWASGLNGTFVVTTDGGDHWRTGVVPGAEKLQFRDVHGVSAKTAYLLAAGVADSSRIYKTTDGGQTWTLQFTNKNPAAFYDCFDFWNPNRGLTFSDPVAGRFPVIRTTDGSNWQDIGDRMPPALDGEFGFAASGTCVATQGGQRAWIATGGSATARILATTNGGNSWNAYPTPIPSGTSRTSAAGAFTVAFRDPHHGLVAGGDFLAAGVIAPNVARSSDGGRTWQATASSAPIAGAVFGLSYVPSQGRLRVVATGPGGTAWSANEGDSWQLIEGLTNFWAVAFATHKAGWLVGTEGRIVKVSF